MSDATANGAPVLQAVLNFPGKGVWVADVEIDADSADDFRERITIDAGADGVFVGTPIPNGVDFYVGRVKARIVGGYGGCNKPCQPKFYRSIPATIALKDALGDGGEKLSSTSLADLQLPFWTRPATSVAEAVEELTDSLGLVWRVLDNGETWCGPETWPEAQLDEHALVISESPGERTAVLSDAAQLRPGTTFRGRHVSRVTLSITPDGIRTQAWFAEEGDAMRVALQKIVRQMTRTIDFLAKIPAKVVSQNGDGSLELRPRNPRWPGLSRIPIRYGVPGVRAKVKPGSYVDVEFEQGDPSQPIATVWSQESVAELTVKADRVVIDAPDIVAQNGRPLARVGDLVGGISSGPGMPFAGQILTGNQSHRG